MPDIVMELEKKFIRMERRTKGYARYHDPIVTDNNWPIVYYRSCSKPAIQI